jgi:pSer/pThr/pTyr-binding forkhead associated (FHA) protein
MAILCPHCQSNQLDGTIFCLECGASLVSDLVQESTRQIGAGPSIVAPITAANPNQTASIGLAITLVVVQTGTRLRLHAAEQLLIGRKDPAKGIYPDVDLGPEGGYDAGVSRKHAILSHRQGKFVIEDLGSANGTFVNGKRLDPQMPIPLRSADELRCGTLALRVEVEA